MKHYSSVGKNVKRYDAEEKVKGTSVFTDDLNFPGTLYAGVYRSPESCGRIKKINTVKAAKIPGVRAVMTAKDIPGRNIVPVVFDDQPLLAEKYVRYHREPLAIVAADDRNTLKKALKAIECDIEETEGVFTIRESLKKKRIVNGLYKDNIFQQYVVEKGDVKKAFAGAFLTVKNSYSTNYQEHAYLEPQSMLVKPELNGIFSVFGSMQCPFYVQDAVSAVLGIGLANVSVHLMSTGGGFGGKEDVPSIVAAVAALLSHRTGRPVKYILDRDEDISVMSKRHPSYIEYESAFSKNGKLLGVRTDYYLDAGAYSTLSPIVLWRGVIHAVGPYECPAVSIKGYAVATNKVPCGAYRGFGTPQIIFASETQMDIAAEKLGIDPVRIRELNAFKKGSETATGQVLKESIGIRKTIDAAVSRCDIGKTRSEIASFNKKQRYKKRGLGISCLFYGVGLGARGGPLQKGGAFVSVFKDGTVQFSVGTAEMGQGMYTVLGQIVSESFGINPSAVLPQRVSTEKVGDSGPTVASRATFISGNALLIACDKIKSSLLSFMLSEKMIRKASDVKFEKGYVYTGGKKKIPFTELSSKAWAGRVKMAEYGWYLPQGTSFDIRTGRGDAYVVYSYATNIAIVEVDMLTYRTKVLKLISAEEFGKVVNPLLAEGQIQGGNAQGIGWSLYENMVVKNGKILTDDFSTYLIPSILDIGQIEPVIVEEPYKGGPWGAKGMGEMPLMGIAPSIGNAIYDATGTRLKKVPFTPEDICNGHKSK